MNNNNTYYQRNREGLLEQAKNRYHHKGGKEQAKEYHEKIKNDFKNRSEINKEN